MTLMRENFSIHVTRELADLVSDIADVQAMNIGNGPSGMYFNYYLDIRQHLDVMYCTGAGLGLRPEHKVLEIGSGLGVRCLGGNAFFGSEFTGLEPCANSYSLVHDAILELQRSNPHLQYAYVNKPGEDAGLPSESFDYVLAFEVIEHVANPEAVIREIYRLLKPGGRAFLSTCNYDSFFEGHYRCLWVPLGGERFKKRYIKMLGYNPAFLDEVNFVTKKKLASYLSAAGFERIRIGAEYRTIPSPTPQIVFHQGFTFKSVEKKASALGKFLQAKSVARLLSYFDREYKLYIEVEK